MAKSIFLTVFTLVHAATGVGCLLLSFLSVFNMCGPAHPATMLTHVTGITGAVALFPLGWLSMALMTWLPSADFAWVIGCVLLNSYLWGLGLWNWRARRSIR